MKSYLAISCLVLVLVLAYATCGTDANNRVRRSVNFTPSWGKRSSGNFEKTSGMLLERGDKCLDKAAYMSMLIETLKVKIRQNSNFCLQKFNFDETCSDIEFEFSRQKFYFDEICSDIEFEFSRQKFNFDEICSDIEFEFLRQKFNFGFLIQFEFSRLKFNC